MKKFLTLVALVISVASFTAKAEEALFKVAFCSPEKKWYDTEMTSEISQDQDNPLKYYIENYLGSGQRVEFNINSDVTTAEDGTHILLKYNTLSVNNSAGTAQRYIVDTDKNRVTFTFTDGTNEFEILRIRAFNNVKYTYIERLSDEDALKAGYRYHAESNTYPFAKQDDVELVDGDATGETWLDFEFYFGDISDIPVPVEPEIVSTENITLNLKMYNSDTQVYEAYAQPQETTLNKYDDGSYEIVDFLGSGLPMSFTFTEPEAGENTIITVNSSEDISSLTSGYYPYFMTGDDYYSISLKSADGESDIALDYPYYDHTTATVYKYTEPQAEEMTGEKYLCTMYMQAYDNDASDYSNWMELTFDFGKDNAGQEGEGSGTVGIEEIISGGNDAPVEYFNLNGVRVLNPSNGIYIRKQGDDVKKIVIR